MQSRNTKFRQALGTLQGRHNILTIVMQSSRGIYEGGELLVAAYGRVHVQPTAPLHGLGVRPFDTIFARVILI